MRNVDVVKSDLQKCIEVEKKRLQVEPRNERRNRIKEGKSEIERRELDVLWEDIDGCCNRPYDSEEYLCELERAVQALDTIDSDEKMQWVSENKMGEIFEDGNVEECFCNNAVIIAERNADEKMWLICLIQRK